MTLGPAPRPEPEQEDLDWLYLFATVAHHYPGIDLDSLSVDVLLALVDELPRVLNPKSETPRERVERKGKTQRNPLTEPWKKAFGR